MNPETLKALQASIKHWERMRDGKNYHDEVPDSKNCNLCIRFAKNGCCLGEELCPVHQKTGAPSCANTPYHDAHTEWYFRTDKHRLSPEWRKCAQAEIDFLTSLLPKESE